MTQKVLRALWRDREGGNVFGLEWIVIFNGDRYTEPPARCYSRSGLASRTEPGRYSPDQASSSPSPVFIMDPGITRSRCGSSRSTPKSGASGPVHWGMTEGS